MNEALRDRLRPVWHALRSAPKRVRSVRRFPPKLHLGCGPLHAEGWCNVDVVDSPAVDVLDDVRLLRRFPSDCATHIYACHVLEHFATDDVPAVLRRWRQVLRPGGELRISVPDLDRIVTIYREHWDHFQTPGNTPWIGLIYGGQLDRFDFHKTGFNLTWMRRLLEMERFSQVMEYPHEPHFIPGFVDASLAKEPFKRFISLNVRAIRPD